MKNKGIKDNPKTLEKLQSSVRSSNPELRTELRLSVGKRIQIIRGETTQKDFSKLLGIHQNSLSRYETGLSEPGFELIQNLCARFNISPSWILTGEGPMKKDEQAPQNKIKQEPEKVIVPLKDLYPDSLPYNGKLLEELIFEIEDFLDSKNASISPSRKSKLIPILYEQLLLQESGKTKDKTKDQIERLLAVLV